MRIVKCTGNHNFKRKYPALDYKASPDTLCKVITFGVIVLFIFIGQENLKAILAAQGDLTPTLIHVGILLLFVSIIIGSYLFSTYSYTVTSDKLIIHRSIKDRVIKISDITEIRTVDLAEFSGIIRTFGVGFQPKNPERI